MRNLFRVRMSTEIPLSLFHLFFAILKYMIFVIVILTGYEWGKNEFNEGTYADCVMDEFKHTYKII